jgi:hypothetical protein
MTTGTVCIIGYPRSGTSLTARIVGLLGVDLGPETDLLPAAQADNARGYWEPMWLNDLNDRILEALGTTWWQPFPASPGWELQPELEELRSEATRLFAERLGGTALSGFKDPRLTLTLPLWRSALRDPLYIVCIRSPVEAVASLQRRPEPTRSVRQWGELWLEYTARAFHETTGAPRLVVFYEDFFTDSARQLARIASFLGLALGTDDPRWAGALETIDGALRHHRTAPFEVAADPGIPAAARALFLALRASQSPDDQTGDQHQLVEAAARVAPELWWDERQGTTARAALRERTGELAAVRAELEHTRHESERLRTELDAAHGAAAAASSEAQRQRDRAAAIESSLSWRSTAPLRSLRRRRRAERT